MMSASPERPAAMFLPEVRLQFSQEQRPDQPARPGRRIWIYILIAALILAAGLLMFAPVQAAPLAMR